MTGHISWQCAMEMAERVHQAIHSVWETTIDEWRDVLYELQREWHELSVQEQREVMIATEL
jgi:hypothetical protein